VFLFEEKSDRDLIFRSGPYFMGARGLYINHLTPHFNPKNDIPSAIPSGSNFPSFPLIDGIMRPFVLSTIHLGNTMTKQTEIWHSDLCPNICGG
jgi:hypothetical protein